MFLAGAVVADAAEDDVMGDGVARLALDLVQRSLKLRVGERLDLAAVGAHEMVVVLVLEDGLVTGCRRADVDALDESVARQLLEAAIDARDPDGAPFGAQPVEDLLRGEAAVLAPEQLDHGAARGAVATTRALEGVEGGFGPAAHWRNDNDYR